MVRAGAPNVAETKCRGASRTDGVMLTDSLSSMVIVPAGVRSSFAAGTLAILVVLAACSGGTGRGNHQNALADESATKISALSPDTAAGTPEEEMVAIARRVRGFGGAYIDEQQRLVVLTVDQSQHADAEREVRARFGDSVAACATVFRAADYDLTELEGWRGVLRTVPFRASISLWVDPRVNRVRVGTNGEFSEIEATLRDHGIPRAAVVIEQHQPVSPATGASIRRPGTR